MCMYDIIRIIMDYTNCKSSMASARIDFFPLVYVLVVNFMVSQSRIISQGKYLNYEWLGAI
jgi:hypothetical protein